jgi:HD-GYP domain-containing protein (c-di-GMP phosphodiesterase class II)
MIINPQVPLHRLILSLSEAMDGADPIVRDHQQRVAYISVRIGQALGLPGDALAALFQAAALHDIGLLTIERRREAVLSELEEIQTHCIVGHRLLKDNPLFAESAQVIRYHHARWDGGRGQLSRGERVPLASHIISLADAVERMIDRSRPLVLQAADIRHRVAEDTPEGFHPDCADAFDDIASSRAFWLDLSSDRIYSVMLELITWPVLVIEEVALGPIAQVFSRLVDAISPWTAVHSAGVAATAAALATRMDFSPREVSLMRSAGYLHDLGKLTVPAAVLDKPGRLDSSERAIIETHTYYTFRVLSTIGGLPQVCEWAAFHHERLDGKGYPFGHAGSDLTLGARIMAVADVFTAVTEDRPYRQGMDQAKAVDILRGLVNGGGLDSNVVDVLIGDAGAISMKRGDEQQAARADQQRLLAPLSEAA